MRRLAVSSNCVINESGLKQVIALRYGCNRYFYRLPAHKAQAACCRLYRPFQHDFFNLADCPRRVQMLRTGIDAVHNRMAAEQAIRIVQIVQTLVGDRIAAVGDKAVGIQQAGRADEFVGIPPERRAGCGAAGAQDALKPSGVPSAAASQTLSSSLDRKSVV